VLLAHHIHAMRNPMTDKSVKVESAQVIIEDSNTKRFLGHKEALIVVPDQSFVDERVTEKLYRDFAQQLARLPLVVKTTDAKAPLTITINYDKPDNSSLAQLISTIQARLRRDHPMTLDTHVVSGAQLMKKDKVSIKSAFGDYSIYK
jgi:hypothetical protein